MIPFALSAALLLVLMLSVLVMLGCVPAWCGRVAKSVATVVALAAGVAIAAAAVFTSFATASTAPDDGLDGHAAHGVSAPAPVVIAEGGDGAAATGKGASSEDRARLPEGFSYVRDFAPGIEVELRYATANNFTGRVVDGYESTDAAILRTDAAKALALVQADLEERGLGLRVYDAFRPTRAVQFFMDWAQTDDDSTKSEYYPDFEKPQLFELGYIAEKSGHSLGGTVDLTLIDPATGRSLDMGGPFDFFGVRSHYEADGLTPEQIANRAVLHEAMLARGFEQYPLEWWHYSYPLPADTQRLDFPVR